MASQQNILEESMGNMFMINIYDNTGKLIKRPDRDLTDEERKENSDFL